MARLPPPPTTLALAPERPASIPTGADATQPAQHRHTLRRRDYDYALAGAYFVTICTYQRACLLGRVTDGQMRISPLGRIAVFCWCDLREHFPAVTLDAFVVMPNHPHGIILLKGIDEHAAFVPDQAGEACLAPTNNHLVGEGQAATVARGGQGLTMAGNGSPPSQGAQRPTLGTIVAAFKSAATRAARQKTGTPNLRLWQRTYYEHVIRTETALARIRQYIENNSAKWALDQDNPDNWRQS
jgi:putative transposase